MENRTEPKTIGQWVRYIGVAAIALWLFQRGLRYGRIATSWLLINLSSAVPTALSVIVYHEPRATPPLAAPTPVTRLPLPRAVTMRVEAKEPVAVPVPGFAQSMEAYQRASQLDVKMAEHLSQIAEQVRTHAVEQKEKASAAEIVQGISFVRDPQSIRSALVASVILGQPRGLEV